MFPSDKLEIRYSKIYNSKANKDIRVLSISDIHISNTFTNEEMIFLIRSVKSECPDYICILGDIIDKADFLDYEINQNIFKKFLVLLSKIAPVFLILGNHDYIIYRKKNEHEEKYNYKFWKEIDKLENVSVINNKKIVLKDIVICGYFEKKNIYHKKTKDAFSKDFINIKDIKLKNSTKPTVLIMHSPEPLDDEENQRIVKEYDIVLCGHYHDGCMPAFLNKVWPIKHGGIITPDKKLFPKCVRGIKKLKYGNYLVYNGGWKKISRKNLCFLDKLCNRQIDITIITNDEKYKNIEIYTKKIKNESKKEPK